MKKLWVINSKNNNEFIINHYEYTLYSLILYGKYDFVYESILSDLVRFVTFLIKLYSPGYSE